MTQHVNVAPGKPAAITVNFVHSAPSRCIHLILDRALTPKEREGLESFDDDFEILWQQDLDYKTDRKRSASTAWKGDS